MPNIAKPPPLSNHLKLTPYFPLELIEGLQKFDLFEKLEQKYSQIINLSTFFFLDFCFSYLCDELDQAGKGGKEKKEAENEDEYREGIEEEDEEFNDDGDYNQRSGHAPGASMIDLSRTTRNGPGPALMFSVMFDDNNIAITPTMLTAAQVDSDLSTNTAYKPMDPQSGLANKAVPLPIPVRINMLTTVANGSGLAQLS